MHCIYCGKPIPDDASFCAYCGKATRPGVQPEGEGDWEYCQILWYGKFHSVRQYWSDVQFWAEAVGKTGKYTAGQSSTFALRPTYTREAAPPWGITDSEREKSAKAHSDLVAKLVGDGWEPLAERGPNAWEMRFRRRTKS